MYSEFFKATFIDFSSRTSNRSPLDIQDLLVLVILMLTFPVLLLFGGCLGEKHVIIRFVYNLTPHLIPILDVFLYIRYSFTKHNTYILISDASVEIDIYHGIFLFWCSFAQTVSCRRLLPVSQRFLVVALGLPVPTYRGTALDPPLRSRFACRFVRGDQDLRLDDVQTKGLQQLVKLWRWGMGGRRALRSMLVGC